MEKFAVGENNFSGRLKWLRDEHLKVGLVQFAGKIQSSKGYVSDLERGVKLNPSRDFVEKVCNAYSVNRPWLENGVGEPFAQMLSGSDEGIIKKSDEGGLTLLLESLTLPQLYDYQDYLTKLARSTQDADHKNKLQRLVRRFIEEQEQRAVSSSSLKLAEAKVVDAVEKKYGKRAESSGVSE